MTNPLLLDIILFLKENNIVSGDGVDAFRDFAPEHPDQLVVLQEYGGDPVSLVDPTVHRSVQVLARDKNANTARQKALSIFKVLQDSCGEDGLVHFTSERWGQVYLRQTPFLLKRDQNDRSYYAFNIGITTTIE